MGILDIIEQAVGNVATAYGKPMQYLQGLGGQAVRGIGEQAMKGLASVEDYVQGGETPILDQIKNNLITAAISPMGYLQGLGGQAVQGLMDAREYMHSLPQRNYIGPKPGSDPWNWEVQATGDPMAPLLNPVNNLENYMGYLAAPISAGEQVAFNPALRKYAPKFVNEGIRAAQRAMRAAGKKPTGMRPSYKITAEGPGSYLSERPQVDKLGAYLDDFGSRPVGRTVPVKESSFAPTRQISDRDREAAQRIADEAEQAFTGNPDVSPFDLGIGQKGRGLPREILDMLMGTGRALESAADTAFKAPGTIISAIARGPLSMKALGRFGREPAGPVSRGINKLGGKVDEALAGGYDFPTDPNIPGTFTKHLGRTEPYKPLSRAAEFQDPNVGATYADLPAGSAGRNIIAGATRAFSRPSGEDWKAILGALGLGAPVVYNMGKGFGDILSGYGVKGVTDLMLPQTMEESQAEAFDAETRRQQRNKYLNQMSAWGLGAPTR